MDGLFKCKQSWVYVPQGKLRLSVWKENVIVLLPAIKEKEKTAIEWCHGDTIGGA